MCSLWADIGTGMLIIVKLFYFAFVLNPYSISRTCFVCRQMWECLSQKFTHISSLLGKMNGLVSAGLPYWLYALPPLPPLPPKKIISPWFERILFRLSMLVVTMKLCIETYFLVTIAFLNLIWLLVTPASFVTAFFSDATLPIRCGGGKVDKNRQQQKIKKI